MALLRGIFTVWVCSVGLAAQEEYNLWAQLLNSSLIDDAPTGPQNLNVSKLFVRLIQNNTDNTYDLNEAVDRFVASCCNQNSLLYVHGFMDSSNSLITNKALENMKRYLNGGSLLAFDHHAYTGLSNVDIVGSYNRAVSYYYDIAIALCEFLIKLYEKCKLIDQIIGHSLGAQICDITSKCFYNRTGVMLSFIKGCDAAGPGFKTFDPIAVYSQAIYCNANQLGIGQSKTTSVLHVNGGVYQRGCYVPIGTELVLTPVSSVCSHLSCPNICTDPAANPGIWKMTPCNPEQNCKTGVSENSETVVASFNSTDLTGDYYGTTGLMNVTPL